MDYDMHILTYIIRMCAHIHTIIIIIRRRMIEVGTDIDLWPHTKAHRQDHAVSIFK